MQRHCALPGHAAQLPRTSAQLPGGSARPALPHPSPAIHITAQRDACRHAACGRLRRPCALAPTPHPQPASPARPIAHRAAPRQPLPCGHADIGTWPHATCTAHAPPPRHPRSRRQFPPHMLMKVLNREHPLRRASRLAQDGSYPGIQPEPTQQDDSDIASGRPPLHGPGTPHDCGAFIPCMQSPACQHVTCARKSRGCHPAPVTWRRSDRRLRAAAAVPSRPGLRSAPLIRIS